MKRAYIELKDKTDLVPSLKNSLTVLRDFKRIGLVSTIQHVHGLKSAKEFLEENGKQVYLAKSTKARGQGISAKHEGQVLGCDVSAASQLDSMVDALLYIGTGQFHPIGIALETEKPVFTLNPHTERIAQVLEGERKKYLARQAARLFKLKEAKKIGIIVSTKPGQYNLDQAEEIRTKLMKNGKQAEIFITDLITEQDLLNFSEVEAWVNTACPRLVDDKFSKPVVNAEELGKAY